MFYLSAECRSCDEDTFYGPCMTTIELDGKPVIPFDFAAQTNFRCEHCGASNYTGEFELLTEDEV